MNSQYKPLLLSLQPRNFEKNQNLPGLSQCSLNPAHSLKLCDQAPSDKKARLGAAEQVFFGICSQFFPRKRDLVINYVSIGVTALVVESESTQAPPFLNGSNQPSENNSFIFF